MTIEELNNEELLKQADRAKSGKTYDSVIFGFLVGVSIYSILNHGFGLLTFLPLLWLPVINRNSKKRKALEEEMEKRGLKNS